MAEQKPLEKMSGPELRTYAREAGLHITHLTERRKEDLVRIIREAEAAARPE